MPPSPPMESDWSFPARSRRPGLGFFHLADRPAASRSYLGANSARPLAGCKWIATVNEDNVVLLWTGRDQKARKGAQRRARQHLVPHLLHGRPGLSPPTPIRTRTCRPARPDTSPSGSKPARSRRTPRPGKSKMSDLPTAAQSLPTAALRRPATPTPRIGRGVRHWAIGNRQS